MFRVKELLHLSDDSVSAAGDVDDMPRMSATKNDVKRLCIAAAAAAAAASLSGVGEFLTSPPTSLLARLDRKLFRRIRFESRDLNDVWNGGGVGVIRAPESRRCSFSESDRHFDSSDVTVVSDDGLPSSEDEASQEVSFDGDDAANVDVCRESAVVDVVHDVGLETTAPLTSLDR